MSNHAVNGHQKIETSNFLMIVLILLTVAIGGIVEIVPLFFQRSTTQPVAGLKPYTALQLAGRDICPRGLLQLPLADDPPAAGRDPALRPLLAGG
jgi:cytochrome c oxidase cbb3-type subunit 2